MLRNGAASTHAGYAFQRIRLVALSISGPSGFASMQQLKAADKPEPRKGLRSFLTDRTAFINMGSITGILTAVIVGIVVLLILAALAPTFITAVADLVNAVENTSFNNTTADSLRSVFGLLIALGGLFALVAYAFIAYRRRGR